MFPKTVLLDAGAVRLSFHSVGSNFVGIDICGACTLYVDCGHWRRSCTELLNAACYFLVDSILFANVFLYVSTKNGWMMCGL
jgi:hypothetical protein